MARYWAVALLALASATAGRAQAGEKKALKSVLDVKAQLTKDDPRDNRRNSPSKVYKVRLKAGTVYQIDMVSTEFDSYLFLDDKNGTQLAQDDDGGGNLNARIIFNCPRDDEYKVITTAFNPDRVGNFTLTVKVQGQEQKTASAHAALVGKAAPDFQGDFTLNGKAVKLSDLKGKVVLLQFWEVRSAPCVATFERLRNWNKAHKEDGLEIVGVTYYHHELGHALGFNKETGSLVKLPKADRASEQAMLRDFAAYHKLAYPLTVLPKNDALKTFDAYAVNGVPQFVLIDRKGDVRLIRVGETDAALTALDAEIKKLFAEK